jgi:hypothetical protein
MISSEEPTGQFLWQLVIQPQVQIPKNAPISSVLPSKSGQRTTNYWTMQHHNSMKPIPVCIVHFPRALVKVFSFSKTDRLITSYNFLDSFQQDDVAMTAHEILDIVIHSFFMVHNFYN